MYAGKEFDTGHHRKNHVLTVMALRRLWDFILGVNCSVLPELR